MKRLCDSRMYLSLFAAALATATVAASLPPKVAENTQSRVPARFDTAGDPLPEHAIARLGTIRFRHGAEIHHIAFFPDGKSLVSVAPEEPGVRIWDAKTGMVRMRIGSNGTWCVAVSPDGKRLATGEDQGNVRVWDAATGRELALLKLPESEPQPQLPGQLNDTFNTVHHVAFANDSNRLVCFHTIDQSIHIWDIERRLPIAALPSSEGDGWLAVTVSGNGRTILAGSAKGEVSVWSAADGKLIRRFPGHAEPISAIAISSDGSRAVTSGRDAAMRGWDLTNEKELWTLPTTAISGTIAFAPGGTMFAVHEFGDLADEGSIKIRSMADGRESRTIPAPFRSAICIAYSPDGKTLAAGGVGNSIRIWQVTSGREVRPQPGHAGPITTVSVSPDGRRVATCSVHDNAVRIWDATTGRSVRLLEDHPAGVDEVQFSPDGRLVATGCWGHPVILWNANTGQLLHPLPDHPSVGPHFRFSRDGKSIATASRNPSVGIWNCATGKLTAEYDAPPNGVASILDFDEHRVVVLERQAPQEDVPNNSIALWDVVTDRLVRRFAGHSGMINGANLSPDHRSLASRGEDQTIRIWEMATGLERQLFRDSGATSGWTGTQFLAFAPDGRTLATAGNHDRFPRLWDLAAGRELDPLRGHHGWIGALEFSSDGRRLVTGGQDTTAIVWDVVERLAPQRERLLTVDERTAAWDALAGKDTAAAYRAVWSLIGGGDSAVAFLREKLRPANSTDRQEIARWIEQLDHPQFAVRERATAALVKVADQIEEELVRALNRATPEARERIRRILDGIHETTQTPERIRMTRTLEVLEGQGTAAARDLLIDLSRGAPQAFLTRESREILKRLDGRAGQ